MRNFYKYQGAGNDFIMIDNRNLDFPSSDVEFIERLCHRKFGIGADGLILIQNFQQADFEMVYYNADGKMGSMCGNGARCSVAFAYFLGIIKQNCVFQAYDGLHEAIFSNKWVSVQLHIQSSIKQISDNQYFIDTGSPHFVEWLDIETLKNVDVNAAGKAIRYSEEYKEKGTNVNFVANTENGIMVRTYERGVENETLSCGTGVTASALIKNMRENKNVSSSYLSVKNTNSVKILVETLGGLLQVEIGEKIMLSGPAEQVFSGKI